MDHSKPKMQSPSMYILRLISPHCKHLISAIQFLTYFSIQPKLQTHGVSLVSKEVDLSVLGEVQETKTEGLVPANGEDVETDLTTNGVLEADVRKLLLQCSHKLFSDLVCLKERERKGGGGGGGWGVSWIKKEVIGILSDEYHLHMCTLSNSKNSILSS